MKIMFVCTGNICRSAMAHRLLEERLKELGKDDLEVYSCGVYAENGDGSTYNAIEAMKAYHVDLSTHRATNIKESGIEEMDLILCASLAHKYTIQQMYPTLKDKVFTIKEYVGYKESNDDMDIMDPWGYDSNIYQKCAEQISICIEMLLEKFYKIY